MYSYKDNVFLRKRIRENLYEEEQFVLFRKSSLSNPYKEKIFWSFFSTHFAMVYQPLKHQLHKMVKQTVADELFKCI